MPFPKSLHGWFLFVVQLAVETLPSSKVSILNPLPCWSLQSFLVCFPSLSTIGWNPWTSARIGNEFAEKPRVHSSQVRREQGTVCLGLSMQVPLLCPFFRGEPPPPQRGVCVSAAGCRHSRYYRILGGAEHRACGRSGASGSGETQGWSCSVNSAGSIASECCGSGPRWGLISQNHLDVCSTRMRIQSASRSVTEQAWASLSVGSSSQNFLLKITTNDR